MVDQKIGKTCPEGVSRQRYNDVKDIASSEGNAKKIDTQKEFDKLSEYLANNTQDMNNTERAFIQEQLDEFKNLEEESKITDNAKKLVKHYTKGSGPDKKKIDSYSEAKDLLAELDNPNNDFNAADKAYILKIVNESGFLQKQDFGLTDGSDTSVGETEAPVDDKPVDEKPVNKKPVDEAPVGEKPVDEKPVNKKPVNKKPVNKKPVNKKPVDKKPVDKKPVNKKPVNKKPVNEKPVNERIRMLGDGGIRGLAKALIRKIQD